MKITKKILEKIIREEMAQLLKENPEFTVGHPYSADQKAKGKATLDKLQSPSSLGTPETRAAAARLKLDAEEAEKKAAAEKKDRRKRYRNDAEMRFWEGPHKLSDIGRIKLYLKNVMADVEKAGLSKTDPLDRPYGGG